MSAKERPTSPAEAEEWLRRHPASTPREVTLVCLPHAGGAASFYRFWRPLLPTSIELVAIQYPGREDRFDDPLISTMTELGDRVATVIQHIERPYVLFGHSMGASVAFEAALRLEAAGHPPVHLIVSARPAPTRQRQGEIHRRTDEELIAHLVGLGGTSAALLEDPSVRDLFLPMIRSDYRIAETYANRTGRKVACPLTVLLGDDDPEISPGEAQAWSEATSGQFDLAVLPGGHFYLVDRRTDVITEVLRRCDAVPPTWPSTP